MKKLLLVAGMIGAVAVANAATFGFSNISNNSGQAAAVAGQLFVDTSTVNGGNRALFWFRNVGPIASSVADIYFDDGPSGTSGDILANDIYRLVDSDDAYNGLARNSGVDFSPIASPSNLPGGNLLTPQFQTTGNLSADSDAPVAARGINPGEWLGVVINLISGRTLADLEAALASGVVRIGLHVQSIGPNEQSDSFVTARPPQVPDAAATAMLLGVALLGLEGMRRRVAK